MRSFGTQHQPEVQAPWFSQSDGWVRPLRALRHRRLHVEQRSGTCRCASTIRWTPTSRCSSPASSDWQHHSGWNAGGGASLSFGRTELFVESRVIAFSPSNTPQARQIPIVFGMNMYGGGSSHATTPDTP